MRQIRFYIPATLLIFALAGCWTGGQSRMLYRSASFRIDRILTHHKPISGKEKILLSELPPEQIWLTGYEIRTDSSQDNVELAKCTLDFFYPQWHNEQHGTVQSARIFNLGPGNDKLLFPAGFGIPQKSNEPLSWTWSVANHDPYHDANEMHLECIVSFDRHRGRQVDYHPLLVRSFEVAPAGKNSWKVPPGGSTVVYDISSQLYLPTDTTLHAASAVLEDFGSEVSLYNATQSQQLLALKAANRPPTGHIHSLESYSDRKGLPVNSTDKLEIKVRYENPGTEPLDASCSLNLYFYDHDYRVSTR